MVWEPVDKIRGVRKRVEEGGAGRNEVLILGTFGVMRSFYYSCMLRMLLFLCYPNK